MIQIPSGLEPFEVDLYKAIFSNCSKLVKQGVSINEAVSQMVEKYRGVIRDPDQLRRFLNEEITVYSEPTIVLTTEEIKRDPWWDNLRQSGESNLAYWRRYYDYMRAKPGWSIKAIDDIDDSTDKVMNAIANPRSNTELERMGMVFGHVQSGKTAHYIGLINKAYDAGYQFIIVLTGIHNSLRSQTQSRIDEEVLGYETGSESISLNEPARNQIGVGIGNNYESEGTFLQTLTSCDEQGDVSKKTLSNFMTPPFVIVTKKVAPVLRNVIRYFEKSPLIQMENGKKIVPANYPALIIDDEADQASINTKDMRDDNGNWLEDCNPSTINGLIRRLLGVFKCRSYVGYTATPYANIFIDPKTPDNPYGSDLFPRDFIFRAPRSGMYIGAREYFGIAGDETAPVMPLYREITTGGGYLGKGTKADDPVGPIPEDLKKAIRYFVISTALRNCRGQVNKPNTMLIHIVRFVGQQNQLKRRVKDYYEDLENMIRYDDLETKEELKLIWENDYRPTTQKMHQSFEKYMDGCAEIDWETLWTEIVRIATKKEIKPYSINGKSKDSLMYKDHKGEPFNVIVIGGDKLSRGLTLEGLTISYFTRSSSAYDTLMQMGRWFGYRPGYLDACRLFTTKDLYGYFSHISMATEDLSDQFEYMDEIDQTPRDFGLRVATHPDLLITSRNKLRTGEEVKRDFSCKLSQTRVFDVDGETNDHNFIEAENLIKAMGAPVSVEEYQAIMKRKRPGEHYFWLGVPGQLVSSFFRGYETSKSASRANSKYMADYVQEMNRIGGINNWTVCLINMKQTDMPGFNIGPLTNVGAGIRRDEGHGVDSSAGTTVSIHTMTSEGHEYYDYEQQELDEVERIKSQPHGEQKLSELIRKATRPFEKGLLILYPIAKAGLLTEKNTGHKTPFGYAVVFPDRKGKGNLKTYRANDVAMEKDNDELYS